MQDKPGNSPIATSDGADNDFDSDSLRSTFQTVMTGTVITMSGTIGFLILSLVWRIVVVRLISVAEWGEMSLALALIGVITALAPLGVGTSVARTISFEEQKEWRGIVFSGMTLTSVSGAVFSLSLFFGADFIANTFKDPGLAYVLHIFSPLIMIGMVIGTLSSVFQGMKNALPNAMFISIIPNVLSITLAAVLYFAGYGFTGILMSALLGPLITLIIMAMYARPRLRRALGNGLRTNRMRMLLAFGLPLLVVNAMSSLMGYADTLILGFFRTDTAVGLYSAGLTLGRIVMVSSSALSFIFLPVASSLFSSNRFRDLERTYSTATKWALVTSVPFLSVFLLYPQESLIFTFGHNYSFAFKVLQISALGIFVASLFGPAASSLVAFGKTRLLAVNSSLAVGLNLVVSFALIPYYGMVGGAIASVIGSLTYGGMSITEVAFFYRLHPFNRFFIKSLSFSLIGSFLILIPLRVSPNLFTLPLIFIGIASIVVASILLTKSVDKTDVLLLEVLEALTKRRFNRVRRIGTLLLGKTS